MSTAYLVALYIRVSTLDQNPEAQRRELEEYARRHNWTIVAVYEDKASGADQKRPAMVEMLKAARAGKFECVLCWKLDRFGRSPVDVIENVNILENEMVRFICITQGIDTDRKNPTAKFFFIVMAAVAELERSLIRERTAIGRKRYQQDMAAGKVGLTVHSKSGKDLPPSRPKKILSLDRILDMRRQGIPLEVIASRLEASRATVARRIQAAVRGQLKHIDAGAGVG